MAIGLPVIDISFSKLAATAVSRSEKGAVCLLIKDATASAEWTVKKYKFLADVAKTEYTEENYKAVADAFEATPNIVYVVRIGTDGELADAKAEIDAIPFNWLAMISGSPTDQSEVVSYIKSRNLATKGRKVKAVVYNATTADDQHIVNFCTAKITRIGESEKDGYLYLGRIAGILAALPFTRSCTYYKLQDLQSVAEPEDVDAAIGAGKLIIINNYGEPMIARGVNSLVTLSAGVTSEFQKITIVEAMDMILEDIYSTFKNSYIGKYKNKLDNQMLFVAAVNGYFKDLTKEDVLDNEFDNVCEIDVGEQRDAWLAEGKSEAETWDDVKVKKMTFKSSLFLKGNIKILDAMEDLEFPITLA